MNSKTLEKVRDKIIYLLKDLDLDITERVELMINLYDFLEPKYYKTNIKTLKKTIKRNDD